MPSYWGKEMKVKMPTIRERYASFISRKQFESLNKGKQRYCFRSDEYGIYYVLPIEQRGLFEYIKEEKWHLNQDNTEELQKRFGEYGVKERLENYCFADPELLSDYYMRKERLFQERIRKVVRGVVLLFSIGLIILLLKLITY